jgi:uracil-DNA glycosylase
MTSDGARKGGTEATASEPGASPIPPGSGWPGDLATASTPVATDPATVVELAATAPTLIELAARTSVCRACPRLVRWREDIAVEKRKAFAGETYWGRPIPGWGSEQPRVVIVGLAPAAHGGNRTGRIFTGDRSGDWLFAALYRAGLAAQETSMHAADSQQLIDTRMLATVRCAPPDNKPTPAERDTCAPWLLAELRRILPAARSGVCLGSFGWDALFRALRALGYEIPRPRPKFGHGARVDLVGPAGNELKVFGCYHPSQQNTFTGKLTTSMLDDVIVAARDA